MLSEEWRFFKVNIDSCCYSGFKIYHGCMLVKAEGKSSKFLSLRTHKAHMLKRNPRMGSAKN